MSHAGCSPECLSEVTRFLCWRCGTAFGETLHWRQGLPEFKDCTACLERTAAVTKCFKVEVVADSSGKWVGNGLTFETVDAAEAYARDLYSRWAAVREWQVVDANGIMERRS